MNATVTTFPILMLDPRRLLMAGNKVGDRVTHAKPVDVRPDLLLAALRDLAAPRPQIAALLPASAAERVPVDRTIAYGHVGLNELPFDVFAAARLAVERMLDHALLYLLGREDNLQWSSAHTNFFKAIQTARRGDPPQRPPAAERMFADFVTVHGEQQRSAKADEARRLAKVLLDLTGLTVPGDLNCGIYELGQRRYHLYPSYGGDGLIIERRTPDGRGWITGQVSFSKFDVAEVEARLEAEFQQRSAVSGRRASHRQDQAKTPPRRGQVIVERGPIHYLDAAGDRLEDIKAELNREVGQAFLHGTQAAKEKTSRVQH